jgi:hypothetical protein
MLFLEGMMLAMLPGFVNLSDCPMALVHFICLWAVKTLGDAAYSGMSWHLSLG